MRAIHVVVSLVLVAVAMLGSSALAGEKDHCVQLSDIYRGRNCGQGDSVQVDIQNDCGVKVTGAVIFNQKSDDPIRFPVKLDSGGRLTAFACHGTGKIDKDFDADR